MSTLYIPERFTSLRTHVRSILILIFLLGAILLTRLHSYLLFHALAELTSVVIGVCVFTIAWESTRLKMGGYLTLIGVGAIFIAGVDVLHILAFKGMGVFPGYDANLPTQLWLAARYLQALTFLATTFFLRRRILVGPAFATYGILTAALLASIFVWKIFPAAYIEGSGLTPFKIASEYIIIGVLLAAIGLLWRGRAALDSSVYLRLIGSIAASIFAELAFTLYFGVTDTANLVGHLFKIVAFYLLYRGLVEVAFTRPYDTMFRHLKQSEQAEREARVEAEQSLHASERKYRALVDNALTGVYQTNLEGIIQFANPELARMLGFDSPSELIGTKVMERYKNPQDRVQLLELVQQEKQVRNFEVDLLARDGQTRSVLLSAWLEDGTLSGMIRDITERKRTEEALRASDALLQSAINILPVGLWIFDAEGKIVISSAAAQRIWAGVRYIDVDQLGEYKGWRTDSGKLIEAHDWAGARALEKGETSIEEEVEIECFDGTHKIILDTAVPLCKSDGSIGGAITINQDITERKQAEDEIRARTEELSALFSLSTRLRQAETTAEIYPIMLNEARQLLQADSGMIVLLATTNRHYTIAFADGDMTPNIGRSFDLDQGLSSIVLRTHQPYASEDYGNDPDRVTSMLGADEIGPVVFVPLQSEVELFGTLMLGRRRSEDAKLFSPTEVHLLATMGEMVGNALRRAQLFEESACRLKRTESLRAIDVAITSSTDLQFTLNAALDQVITELGVDAADVLLFNSTTQILKYAAGRGFRSNTYSRTQVRLGDGQAGKAALERQIVAHPDFTVSQPIFAMPELMAGENFVAYYVVPLIAKGNVKGVLEIFHRAPLHPDDEWLSFLETLGGQIAIAVDNATMFSDLHRSNFELSTAYNATIEGWSRALDLRDEETEGHSARVTGMTMRLAQTMGLSDEELMHIQCGALLHDMGKLGVPDGILLKPGKLTDEEWVLMRRHPQFAFDMLAPIPFLKKALDIPYCHHEKWDGTGYPRGLKGEQIPLAARLFAIVDVWDALRSDRPYRPRWSEEKVRAHILADSGKHFDPQVVKAFMRMLDATP